MTHPVIIAGAGVAGLGRRFTPRPRPVILLTGSRLGEHVDSLGPGRRSGCAGPMTMRRSSTPRIRSPRAPDWSTRTRRACCPRRDRARSKTCSHWARPLKRTDGQGWALSREAAHSRARVARMKGDQAGAGILAALIRAVKAAVHIEIREGWKAETLLRDAKGGCAGGAGPRPKPAAFIASRRRTPCWRPVLWAGCSP